MTLPEIFNLGDFTIMDVKTYKHEKYPDMLLTQGHNLTCERISDILAAQVTVKLDTQLSINIKMD